MTEQNPASETETPVYLEFSGWCELDPNTPMTYFGEDGSKPSIITVREFINLPKNEKQFYVVEDVVAALRDSFNIEYEDVTVKTEP
jgi:hypothetical protein